MPLKIKPVLGHLYFDEVNADNMYQLNSLIEDTEKDKQYVKEKLKMLKFFALMELQKKNIN